MSQPNYLFEEPLIEADFTHALCIGETGSGKTTGFILPNIKNRIALGHGVMVFDYKGNLNHQVKQIAKSSGVLGRVVEIGTPWSKCFNPIANMNPNDVEKFIYTMQEGSVGSRNHFWHQASARLFANVYKAQKAIYNIVDLLNIPSQIPVWQQTIGGVIRVEKNAEEFAKKITKSTFSSRDKVEGEPTKTYIEALEASLYSVAKVFTDAVGFIGFCASLHAVGELFSEIVVLKDRLDDDEVVSSLADLLDAASSLKDYAGMKTNIDGDGSG
jgi:hypothetical protein